MCIVGKRVLLRGKLGFNFKLLNVKEMWEECCSQSIPDIREGLKGNRTDLQCCRSILSVPIPSKYTALKRENHLVLRGLRGPFVHFWIGNFCLEKALHCMWGFEENYRLWVVNCCLQQDPRILHRRVQGKSIQMLFSLGKLGLGAIITHHILDKTGKVATCII